MDALYKDHVKKCRCCFEKFSKYDLQLEITEDIRQKFLKLTNIQVSNFK